MKSISLDTLKSLIQQGDENGLLDYVIEAEVPASIQLVELKNNDGNFDPQKAQELVTYYSVFMWTMILKQQDAELKNVVSKIENTRLDGGPEIVKTLEAVNAYFDLDFPVLYAQDWSSSSNEIVSSLANYTVQQVRLWMYRFIESHYTSITESALQRLLGLESDYLTHLNSQRQGWVEQEGLYIPPALHEDLSQVAADKSDEDKKVKIDRLVKLAALLEQQSYLQ